jgi:hypothetical protein
MSVYFYFFLSPFRFIQHERLIYFKYSVKRVLVKLIYHKIVFLIEFLIIYFLDIQLIFLDFDDNSIHKMIPAKRDQGGKILNFDVFFAACFLLALLKFSHWF